MTGEASAMIISLFLSVDVLVVVGSVFVAIVVIRWLDPFEKLV